MSSAVKSASISAACNEALKPANRSALMSKVSAASLLIILLLGGIGVVGGFHGSGLGWLTVGFGTGGFALAYFASRKESDRKWTSKAEIVAAVAMFILGILGATGAITPVQVGQGIIGMFVVGAGLHLGRKSFGGFCNKKPQLNG